MAHCHLQPESATSIDLDIGRFDDRAPFVDFRLQYDCKLFGRRAAGCIDHALELALDRGIGECGAGVGAHLAHDCRGGRPILLRSDAQFSLEKCVRFEE